MILVDANLLVYAHVGSFPQHARAREWLDAQFNLVPDAHLAALAIEHGLLLCSTDGDFARFPDLRWSNPLSG